MSAGSASVARGPPTVMSGLRISVQMAAMGNVFFLTKLIFFPKLKIIFFEGELIEKHGARGRVALNHYIFSEISEDPGSVLFAMFLP